MPCQIAAFYHFTPIADATQVADATRSQCRALGLKGTMLVASEGVNGTLAGSPGAIAGFIASLEKRLGLTSKPLMVKFATAARPPFKRLKVKAKAEIITMGRRHSNLDLATSQNSTGQYVTAKEWNALLSEENVVAIDTRNDYEVAIGSFKGAINPNTQHFSEFPKWLKNWHKQQQETPTKPMPKLALFCTGGIRCEKATAYARQLGFAEVYHLQGGILQYLADIPPAESLWQGACFVFDERVAVSHGLATTDHSLCYACRRPLSAEERASRHYQPGVACPHCIAETSPADKTRFAERQKQIGLAKQRGAVHIGVSRPRN